MAAYQSCYLNVGISFKRSNLTSLSLVCSQSWWTTKTGSCFPGRYRNILCDPEPNSRRPLGTSFLILCPCRQVFRGEPSLIGWTRNITKSLSNFSCAKSGGGLACRGWTLYYYAEENMQRTSLSMKTVQIQKWLSTMLSTEYWICLKTAVCRWNSSLCRQKKLL